MSIRRWIALGALLLVLLAVNVLIVRAEQLRQSGRIFWMELAPVDPRSLMQGDYMALDFALAQDLARQLQSLAAPPVQGLAVLELDAESVARSIRLYDPPLEVNGQQQLLRFQRSGGRVRLVTDAWFFPEGQADRYARAGYGQFRGAPDGRALLVGMADDRRVPISP